MAPSCSPSPRTCSPRVWACAELRQGAGGAVGHSASWLRHHLLPVLDFPSESSCPRGPLCPPAPLTIPLQPPHNGTNTLPTSSPLPAHSVHHPVQWHFVDIWAQYYLGYCPFFKNHLFCKVEDILLISLKNQTSGFLTVSLIFFSFSFTCSII